MAKKAVREVRINKQGQYLFGPAARGADHADTDTNELVPFMTTSEQGVTYPREHDGGHFLEMGITTFADYLNRNPEGLRPGRRFFFYEKTGDGYRLVHTGTMKPSKDVRIALGDDKGGSANAHSAESSSIQPHSQPQQIVVRMPDESRHNAPRVSLEEIIDQMREDVRSLRAENAAMLGRMTDLHTKIIEADQRRLSAENELQLERERHERDIEAMKAEHARAIETQNALHSKDIEILSGRAIEEARLALKDESLADDTEPLFERLMDIVSPFIQPASELAKTWFETKLHERRMRHMQQQHVTQGTPAATNHGGPQHSEQGRSVPPQPTAQVHDPGAVRTDAAQYPIVQDPMMMFQRVQG